MKFPIIPFLRKEKKIIGKKTLAEYKQDVLIQQGKEQIENLVRRGLRLPIALG